MERGVKLLRAGALVVVMLAPAVPAMALPDTPEIQVPDLPPVEVPDIPAVPVPDLPPLTTPDVPPVTTPDVPGTPTPDVPPIQTPDPAPDPTPDPTPTPAEPAPEPEPRRDEQRSPEPSESPQPQADDDPSPQAGADGTPGGGGGSPGADDGLYNEEPSPSSGGSDATAESGSGTGIEPISSVDELPRLEPAAFVAQRDPVPTDQLDVGDVAGVSESGDGDSQGRSPVPLTSLGAPASDGWSAPMLPLFMLIAASAAGVVALVVVRLRQTLPHGDTGFTRGSSLGQVAPDVSPGDKTGAQGPPATDVAASAPVESAGGSVRTSRTGPPAPSSVGVRRNGGLIGAASPRARRMIQRFTERRRGK